MKIKKMKNRNFISEDLHEHIKNKAHELYEGRGHLPGSDMTDWLQAERIVRQELGDHAVPEAEIEALIRMKAYEIYEGRGHLPAGDMADWLEAERIILSQQE